MRKILDDFNMPLNEDNPVYKVHKLSCQSLPKRFYKEVSISRHGEGGFSVLLDGNPVKTPARHYLRMPTEALAALVAQEFTVQEKTLTQEECQSRVLLTLLLMV